MSKQHNITVIAGLSGVGKSFLISKTIETGNNYIHFSAGQLIKKRQANIDHDKLRLLNKNEILRNQHLLIDQFNIELNSTPTGAHILFDAHMLVDTDDETIEIPFEIFKKLNPSRIVFLYEDPSVILNRRAGDSSRKRPIKTTTEIQEQQNRSKSLAQEYCDKLSIKFIIHSSTEIDEFSEKIASKLAT